VSNEPLKLKAIWAVVESQPEGVGGNVPQKTKRLSAMRNNSTLVVPLEMMAMGVLLGSNLPLEFWAVSPQIADGSNALKTSAMGVLLGPLAFWAVGPQIADGSNALKTSAMGVLLGPLAFWAVGPQFADGSNALKISAMGVLLGSNLPLAFWACAIAGGSNALKMLAMGVGKLLLLSPQMGGVPLEMTAMGLLLGSNLPLAFWACAVSPQLAGGSNALKMEVGKSLQLLVGAGGL